MNVTPKLIRTGIPELLPMVRSGRPDDHVSAVIRSLCLQLGHFEESEVTEETVTRWELGSAFEQAVINGLTTRYHTSDPERYVLIGELEHDNLIGTPDMGDLLDMAILEMKLTWLSSNHDPSGIKFWKYWVQGGAYAYMMDWRIVRLHVCHIMGNYRDKRDPTYNVWENIFTVDELRQNWRMLRAEQKRMLERSMADSQGSSRRKAKKQ